ncbi:DNA topoisomerase IB [Mumia sp. zg.B17]|uniref:DNA topoisomerase IB n=1 Tax=unclassified Mumia TaxID=2621872 RepID=UPI001C6E0DD5|nr:MULTISPECIES: DNA topoisomerase IB [unclassified Mumia]MBW9207091.1 DNA topoisomerase IB [Mumia sp. zg.B17]MDD9347591.1 DNA topoisomerase IB [Mumia sp.]
MRFRTVSRSERGWSRRRVGQGFRYLDEQGHPLGGEDRARCESLAIPPAWEDVWICRWPSGHLQATGIDAAGRVQYLYHPLWRERMERQKHERVLDVAHRLPEGRERVLRDLDAAGVPRDKALGAAFRLLDRGLFRVGNDRYAANGGGYGLATLRKDHVTLRRDRSTMEFAYEGKSGVSQRIQVTDPLTYEVVGPMRRRRGGETLLAFQERRRWTELSSPDVNAYLQERVCADMTAKDFRTWHATVLAAVSLASKDEASRTAAARRRAVASTMREVSDVLGNTPTVARSSYVNPRVIELFEDGVTVAPTLRMLGPRIDEERDRPTLERAVLNLLTDEA